MKDLLTRAADAVDRHFFNPNSGHKNCIDASLVLTEVLSHFGVWAFHEPVKVSVWNAAGWANRNSRTDLPPRDRPVGAGHTAEIAKEGEFNGHMIVIAKKYGTSDFWLVDATVRQFGNVNENRPIDCSVVVPLRQLGAGVGRMLPADGVTVPLAGSVLVLYEVMDPAYPQLLAVDLAWDEALYTEDIAEVLASLGESA